MSLEAKKQKLFKWEQERALPGDEQALLVLFQQAFGQELPAEQWRWKYAEADPWGILVRTGGRPVAFYGGMPRRIRFFGEETNGVQIGDVMVEPSHRRILTKRGPFFLAASSFAEQFIGPGKPYRLSFGFPSERHSRLGERLGLYKRIGENILEASWTAVPHRLSPWMQVRALQPDQLGSVDSLWQEMAADMTDYILPVRDTAFFQHRYLNHPRAAYLPFLVRRRLGGKPLGIFVLLDKGESEGVELLDMIAPRKNLPLLVESARRIVGKLGRSRVFAWFSGAAAVAVADTAPLLKTLDIPFSTIVWEIPPEALCLQDRWWLMSGDADFR
jgi:hypothetical protein